MKNFINKNTTIFSLQNGLDNIKKIKQIIDKNQIIAGITTHGAILSRPGVIQHTGLGDTVIGELDGSFSDRLDKIVKIFNKVNIKTEISENIIRDIWIKAIINSSINPITAIFKCKNGYLLENPILETFVEKICIESTNIANQEVTDIPIDFVLKKTKDVIRLTSDNYSSMLQSINKSKRTEIDSINKKIVEIGKNKSINVTYNNVVIEIIKSM